VTATTNNFLSHPQQVKFAQALQSCKGDAACIASVTQQYQALSYSQAGLDTPDAQQAWGNDVTQSYNQNIAPLCNGNAACIQATTAVTQFYSILNAGDPEGMAYAMDQVKADVLNAQGSNFSAFMTRYGELIGVVTAVLPATAPGKAAATGVGAVAEGATVAKGAAGAVADSSGILANANFAQKTFSSAFSMTGDLAGKTVDDVAAALRSGTMNVTDVPVQYIVRDGNTLILNTRSAQALEQAGIPRSQWNAVNMTGNADAELRLTTQLQNNGLTSQGTPTIRPSSSGK
jgi:hypothetical protein